MRSGMVTVLLLACVLVGLTVGIPGAHAGQFPQAEAKICDKRTAGRSGPRPGGRSAIVLAAVAADGGHGGRSFFRPLCCLGAA